MLHWKVYGVHVLGAGWLEKHGGRGSIASGSGDPYIHTDYVVDVVAAVDVLSVVCNVVRDPELCERPSIHEVLWKDGPPVFDEEASIVAMQGGVSQASSFGQLQGGVTQASSFVPYDATYDRAHDPIYRDNIGLRTPSPIRNILPLQEPIQAQYMACAYSVLCSESL